MSSPCPSTSDRIVRLPPGNAFPGLLSSFIARGGTASSGERSAYGNILKSQPSPEWGGPPELRSLLLPNQ